MSGRRVKFDLRQATKPLLVILGLWLIGCVASYFFLVRPKVNEYRQLVSGSAPQFQALEQARKIVESKEEFLAALEQARTDLETLRTDVLSTREARLVSVQAEVLDLCEQFNIDFESVVFDNEELPEEGLDRLVMVVPLQGGYSNLRRFLQAIEDSDKFLLVERVALAEGKEGGVMLQLSITLTTYFELPEELRKKRTRRRRPRGRA